MDGDRTGRRLPRPPAVFVLVFLGALLVVFGAAALPSMTHHSPQGLVLPAPDITQPAAAPASSAPAEEDTGAGHRPDDAAIGRIGQAIAAVLFGVVVLFVVGMALSLRRGARAADPPPAVPVDDIAAEARLRAEVAATLARAQTSLVDATPAQAGPGIIACWAELERLAAAHGLRRDRALTPTEQAAAMLAAFGVAAPPLARLLALYERVRYDVAVPGFQPDPGQVRQAGADFARLAADVGASGRARTGTRT
ncbi:hypothetical protein GCM10009596_21640 [Arthrobacter rhombi]|uniref:DUF4129 domain-containing protein n=1 Tax=Arthrobacter rhombi TaxID=71253 RepID=UPI0031DD859C